MPSERANGRSTPVKRRDTVAIVQGLRRVVKALHAYSQDVRSTYGLTGPQLWALKTIQQHRRVSVGRLAEVLAVHQSSASILLNRLEQRGLVRRLPGREDRRFVDMELTRRGVALAAEAPEPAQGRLLHSLQAMPPQRVHRLRDAVDDLVRAMEATDIKARFFFTDE